MCVYYPLSNSLFSMALILLAVSKESFTENNKLSLSSFQMVCSKISRYFQSLISC